MRQAYIFIILTSLVVISQENPDDIVSSLVNDIQQEINITCLCTEDEKCDSNSGTCRITNPDQACYESWTKDPHENTIYVTAGCVHNEFLFTKFFCNGNQTDRYIICCSDTHYCNDRDAYSSNIRKQLLLQNKRTTRYKTVYFILILLIIISLIVLLSSVIGLILFRIKRKRENSSKSNKTNESNKWQRLFKYSCFHSKNSISDVLDTISEVSTVYGAPLLAIDSFAKQVKLEEKHIGRGRYGSVYRGQWREDTIAVKIFPSHEEPSWLREVFIYEQVGINHENILRYIAADRIDVSDRIELWLGTEYHANGSVYDYLRTNTVTVPDMIKMISSIANGLCHLHLPIDATQGKVAIAHRDIKTRNILVKKDLSCCIADLGLAVREVRPYRNNLIHNNNNNQESIVIDICPNHRAGTTRYMAPEILDRTLNDQSFESYRAADVYALGLVFWEILRRCRTTSEENDADVHKLPYEDDIEDNGSSGPTFEKMHEIVNEKKIRPLPSPRWENHSIFQFIFKLCQDLWLESPACRPGTAHIKKLLKDQKELIQNESKMNNIQSQREGPLTV